MKAAVTVFTQVQAGFLSLGTVHIGAREFSVVGTVVCILGYWAASWASRQQQHPSTHPPQS